MLCLGVCKSLQSEYHAAVCCCAKCSYLEGVTRGRLAWLLRETRERGCHLLGETVVFLLVHTPAPLALQNAWAKGIPNIGTAGGGRDWRGDPLAAARLDVARGGRPPGGVDARQECRRGRQPVPRHHAQAENGHSAAGGVNARLRAAFEVPERQNRPIRTRHGVPLEFALPEPAL